MTKKTIREACRLANEEGDQTLCEHENCPWYGDPDGCNHPLRCRDVAPYGNAAAMRYALIRVEDELSTMNPDGWGETLAEVRAALSEPARNCDRFRDELDAQLSFLNDVWLISVDKDTMLEKDKFDNWTELMKTRYARWLLEPCEEKSNDD